MTEYIFRTTEASHLGSVYGYHTFVILADSKKAAWDLVRKETKLALTIVSQDEVG